MINFFEIPLLPTPQSITIQLVNVTYTMIAMWNTVANAWVLNIADINQVPIVSGIPLITGANLLEQYDYLNFGGALFVQTDNDVDAVPTFDNLGINGHLFFITS